MFVPGNEVEPLSASGGLRSDLKQPTTNGGVPQEFNETSGHLVLKCLSFTEHDLPGSRLEGGIHQQPAEERLELPPTSTAFSSSGV